jgi:putative chitinase
MKPVTSALVVDETVPGLADALRAAAPAASAERWLPALQAAMVHWEITEPRRVAAAVGQFAAEAGEDFGRLTENLNYTTAARIHAVFPHCFPTVAAAEPFCRAPEKLANVVYAHQDGNTAPGDGWRYIGRGLIQLTGKARYQAFARSMGLNLSDAVAWCETPAGAAMSGCWYLASHGCLDLAERWLVDEISRKVNGASSTTLDKRRALSDRALQAMTPAMAA